jgi:hypothetical protein
MKYSVVAPLQNGGGGWWKVVLADKGAVEIVAMIAPNCPTPEMWAKLIADQANRGLKKT